MPTELAGVVKGATDEGWRLGVLMWKGYDLTRATRERQERELASGRKKRGEERKERAKSEGR